MSIGTTGSVAMTTHMTAPDRAPAEIRLFWFSLANVDDALRRRCLGTLDESERSRHARFLSADAADQFLVGRGLLRRALSRCASLAPPDWRFELSDFGKPRVAASHRLDGLAFNVSHTRGMVACAVGQDCDIGLDVERLAKPYTPEIAERFFTPSEAAAIAAAPPELRADRFLKTWTLKEAVVKATGQGLSCPLSAFDVRIDDNPPQVEFSAQMPEVPERWKLFVPRIADEFHVAIAVRSPFDRDVILSVERFPLET